VRKFFVAFALLSTGISLWTSTAAEQEQECAATGPGSPRAAAVASVGYTPFGGISLAMADSLSERHGSLQLPRGVVGLSPPRNGLRPPHAVGMQDGVVSDLPPQYLHSRFQPGVDAPERRGNGDPAASSAMHSYPQPGNAALLIAGLLGMCAVARRRISSILA
jgi:hypothetical protein